jgi:hypothetical protein
MLMETAAIHWPMKQPLGSEPRFVCSACGNRSAHIRPNFDWDKPAALARVIDRGATGRAHSVRSTAAWIVAWTAASIGVDSLVRSRVQSGVSRLDHYQSEGHYNLRYPFGSCWRAIRQRPLNSLELSTLPPTVSDTHLGHFALITGGLTEKNTTGEV